MKNILAAMYAYLQQVCFEEIIFRGLLFGFIWWYWNWEAATIISALVYGIAHLIEFRWPMMVFATVLGVLLGYLYYGYWSPFNIFLVIIVHYIAGFTCWALGLTGMWSRKKGRWQPIL